MATACNITCAVYLTAVKTIIFFFLSKIGDSSIDGVKNPIKPSL